MTRSTSRWREALTALLLVLPVSTAMAQARTPTDTSKAQQTLFNARDAWLAAGFVGLTIAMFPIDKHIETHLRDQSVPANRFFDRSATGFESITTPGSFIIGGALYGIGVVTDRPNLKDLGWHGTEAVLLGSGITGVLKGVLGRARPDMFPDTRPISSSRRVSPSPIANRSHRVTPPRRSPRQLL